LLQCALACCSALQKSHILTSYNRSQELVNARIHKNKLISQNETLQEQNAFLLVQLKAARDSVILNQEGEVGGGEGGVSADGYVREREEKIRAKERER